MAEDLERLLAEIRSCRLCVEAPVGRPLPHAPRPVVRAAASARLAIFSQAPGTRVHAYGIPFLDPSGDRLRDWMEISPQEFYDERRVAIVPMGFCFPGLDAKGGDLPPRRECAPAWRARVMAALPRLEVMLLVGRYAQRWHLSGLDGARVHRSGVTETVANWHHVLDGAGLAPARTPRVFVLPHPSWRNNVWIKRNPWFEAELLPVLRADVRRVLDAPDVG